MSLIVMAITTRAQQVSSDEKQVVVDPSSIFTSVEQMPQFPGGMEKFMEYLKTNLKYPAVARQNYVQGKVFVRFIVEKDGSLTDVKIVRGIGNGCDEEAQRLVKSSPKWNPGIQNGTPVRVYYTLPVSFSLVVQVQQVVLTKANPNADIIIDEPVGNADVKQVTNDDPNKIYTSVEQEPLFPGGMQKLAEYLKTNLKYPAVARDNQVQGKVFVNFIVEKDGSLTDVKIVRGIGSGCDEEAQRLIKSSPKWRPGIQNGRAVRVYYTMPISFSLDAN